MEQRQEAKVGAIERGIEVLRRKEEVEEEEEKEEEEEE